MKFQPGVISVGVIPQVWYGLGVADALHRDMFGREVEITSLNDRKHRPDSLHYEGRAFDLRTRHLSPVQRTAFLQALQARLDLHGFDTVDELDHIHSEWDPKPEETWIGAAPD